MINIPQDVQDWIRGVFQRCNNQATAKLDRNPFAYEEHLDQSVIEMLQQESIAVGFDSGWIVKIDTHFLGKFRMWNTFEIADIGLLVMFRSGNKLVRTKVALLQSKRLYPDNVEPEAPEQIEERYMKGFSNVRPSDDEFDAMVHEQTVTFRPSSLYKAMKGNSQQCKNIDHYERASEIPVYYLFYNPSHLPLSVNVPASVIPSPHVNDVGVRVMAASSVHKVFGDSTASPSYDFLATVGKPYIDADTAGWRLETFVVDQLLQCREGKVTELRRDSPLYNAFYRRAAPIAAALSVTIGAPAAFDWEFSEEG